MGRGSYFGGGTLINVGGDTSTYRWPRIRLKGGKKFKGIEGINSAWMTSTARKRKRKLVRGQKYDALLEIVRAEVHQKAIVLPARLSRCIRDSIRHAGGALQWARQQKDYSRIKAELENHWRKKPAKKIAVEYKGLSIHLNELSFERFLALRARGWKIKGDRIYAPKENFAKPAAATARDRTARERPDV